MAALLANIHISRIISSTEVKAIETGEIIANKLSLLLIQRDGLQEHERTNLGVLSPSDFQLGMGLMFSRPSQHVFGDESADDARVRFETSLNSLMESSQEDELVVSHGTVMSLLIAHKNKLDARQLWETISMPDHFVLQWPSFKIISHMSPTSLG
ncbi:hypothetical protein GCM10008957_52420 [Deinococcus ruber]|uniref:Phosphoglycerate mutase n=1 Tax=Deinococcus ruber TaxID=1848197 RepID=A0A918FGE8_9DEIO|nr:hypothetical protein GCM10008957_52420 [Deinococcus ruber]